MNKWNITLVMSYYWRYFNWLKVNWSKDILPTCNGNVNWSKWQLAKPEVMLPSIEGMGGWSGFSSKDGHIEGHWTSHNDSFLVTFGEWEGWKCYFTKLTWVVPFTKYIHLFHDRFSEKYHLCRFDEMPPLMCIRRNSTGWQFIENVRGTLINLVNRYP